MWLNSKNVNFVINFQHIVWKQWIVFVINHPRTYITTLPGCVFPVGFGKVIYLWFLFLFSSILNMVYIQESREMAMIKSNGIFFLLSSILAWNHISCPFFSDSPHFFQTSFCLLMCGLGVWPLVWVSSISCGNAFPPLVLSCLPYKICRPLACSSYSGCASPRVSRSVSQNILCWILILKVHPWG